MVDRLVDSVTRLVEAALLGAVFEAAGRAIDRLDPVGTEARESLTDEKLAEFVGDGA